jgi:hypothetical protein
LGKVAEARTTIAKSDREDRTQGHDDDQQRKGEDDECRPIEGAPHTHGKASSRIKRIQGKLEERAKHNRSSPGPQARFDNWSILGLTLKGRNR